MISGHQQDGRCVRQSANWEGLAGCAPSQASHMVLNILFDAHAAPMRSAFGAQTRCSSRPLRQRAVRVSAAAVQQQPRRSFKLAAAVCQLWQSHQQQTASCAEQVSIHGRVNTCSPGRSISWPLMWLHIGEPLVFPSSHLYTAPVLCTLKLPGLGCARCARLQLIKCSPTELLPRTHAVASHPHRVSSSSSSWHCTALHTGRAAAGEPGGPDPAAQGTVQRHGSSAALCQQHGHQGLQQQPGRDLLWPCQGCGCEWHTQLASLEVLGSLNPPRHSRFRLPQARACISTCVGLCPPSRPPKGQHGWGNGSGQSQGVSSHVCLQQPVAQGAAAGAV